MCLDSNAEITSDDLNIVGGYNFQSNSKFTGNNLNTGTSAIADPLADLPEPTPVIYLGSVNYVGNEIVTITPGYYSGGRVDSANRLSPPSDSMSTMPPFSQYFLIALISWDVKALRPCPARR